MWTFALGLYLVVLAGEHVLRLNAIYGLLMGVSVLLFGGVIGAWVDKTNRKRGKHLQQQFSASHMTVHC